MGRPKADLPFGDETMLARVVRIVGEVVEVPPAVQNVLPVADHAEFAELRVDPIPLLKGIFNTFETWNKGPAVQGHAFAGRSFRQFQEGRVEIGEVDQVP